MVWYIRTDRSPTTVYYSGYSCSVSFNNKLTHTTLASFGVVGLGWNAASLF